MTPIQRTILSVLDSELQIHSKRIEINKLNQKRREHNRILLRAVEMLLYEYVLPATAGDEFSHSYFDALDDKHFSVLSVLAEKTNCVFFRATCGELLWTYKKNYCAALSALKAYSEELRFPSYEGSRHVLRVRMSICRIYSKCKSQEYDYDRFFEECLDWLKTKDETGVIINMVYSLAKCRQRNEDLASFILERFQDAEKRNKDEDVIAFGDFITGDFNKENKIPRAKRSMVLKVMAESAERLADSLSDGSHHPFQAVYQYKNAIRYWTMSELSEMKSRREVIAGKMDQVQQHSVESMQAIELGLFDISDQIERFRKRINDASFERVLWDLAHLIPLESVKSVQNSNGSILDDLVSKPVLDDRGKTKYIVPPRFSSNRKAQLAWAENEAAESYRISARLLLQPFVHLAKERFEFNEETLGFMMEPNLFIPPDRKESFMKGLIAGFNLDLPLAMSILMPQVENSIRRIAEMCGANVYNVEPDDSEKVVPLDRLFINDYLSEKMEEDLLFNLRLFYTSRFGFGMRNEVSHGLKSDAELQDASSLATWWFTLYLCCSYSGKLTERICQENKEQEDKWTEEKE